MTTTGKITEQMTVNEISNYKLIITLSKNIRKPRRFSQNIALIRAVAARLALPSRQNEMGRI